MSELRFLKHYTPSQPHAAMVLPADARAMGAVKATTVGGANKKPRTSSRATDCKVTRADGSTYIISATSERKQRTPAQLRFARECRDADKINAQDAIRRNNRTSHASSFAPIGNVE